MILTALCLSLIPSFTAPAGRAAAPAPEPASPVLLARLPRQDAAGRECFLGCGADPGGRLLLVLGSPDDSAAPWDLAERVLRPVSQRWLDADGAGQVHFSLPPAEGLEVQLWRPGGADQGRAVSRAMPLARVLAANYDGPPAVITEFMKDPTDVSDSHGEWVEITNLQPWRLNLEGWVLSDDGSNASILGGGTEVLRCGPGESIVVGGDADPATNGGVPVLGEWSSFTLTNSSDEIILSTPDGVVVDRVDYDDGVLWPDTAGRSISLDPSAYDVTANDDPANWCHSQLPWIGGGTDTGTPGLPNEACN
ncbi:MAG: lamin tail domain-containing protein [Planctomycetes bacterium]|nr:lamin tail domain-containing protein [Planctomycetota bacterium]MCB9904045.1 lamin tail domain-containing protein [Planctomycetota bacterium]